jgi:hypothetical protein
MMNVLNYALSLASNPTIALQLEDGKRLMGEFPIETSLYDVLQHFQSTQ